MAVFSEWVGADGEGTSVETAMRLAQGPPVGGQPVVGIDPASRRWVTEPVPGLVPAPELRGELVIDEVARASAAYDFGHLACAWPSAVCRPATVEDVAATVDFAGRHSMSVAACGSRHSTGGQALAPDGIVVDMATLSAVREVGADRVMVEAGTRWSALLAATLPHGLMPPVLTDYLEATVGGTLSVGGIGGTSHRYGTQVDTVLDVEVVTGDGQIRTCSPDRCRDLFDAVLAGLGQCALITAATLRLIPAPTRVRRFQFFPPNLAALLADQQQILSDGRVDYLEGQILPNPEGGWTHLLEAASFADPPPDTSAFADLAHQPEHAVVEDLTVTDFALRMAPGEAYLRSTGEWHHPHPWCTLFLPASIAPRLLDTLMADLAPAAIGPSGLILLYPVRTAGFTRPLLRLPDQPTAYLVGMLRTAPPDDPHALRDMGEANQAFTEQVLNLGGTIYPIGALPAGPDWRAHYGPAWPALAAAKDQFDPSQILTPGPGVF